MTTSPISNAASTRRHVDALSRLLLLGYSNDFSAPNEDLKPVFADIEYVSGLDQASRAEFLRLGNTHHVTVRALEVVRKSAATQGRKEIVDWCEQILAEETARIHHAVEFLPQICEALESAGAAVAVIKSLDHWPDLGSDLDLYTPAAPSTVVNVIKTNFRAQQEPRSWGDRLANKWNFSIPGLPELIEIHIRYLGQTGEQDAMARRVIDRSVLKTIGGFTFRVPAPEERVLISTLQRMYRHFYFRLCDMADFACLLQNDAIDFDELKNAAGLGGIWPGVATFLLLVSKYAESFGVRLSVPDDVVDSAQSRQINVYVGGDFLRVPKGPAAALYSAQLFEAMRHVNIRAMSRLPLLPPLAISALAAYKLTGSDKGVW